MADNDLKSWIRDEGIGKLIIPFTNIYVDSYGCSRVKVVMQDLGQMEVRLTVGGSERMAV